MKTLRKKLQSALTNHTVNNSDAVPFTDFATLPDPDLAATDNAPDASLCL